MTDEQIARWQLRIVKFVEWIETHNAEDCSRAASKMAGVLLLTTPKGRYARIQHACMAFLSAEYMYHARACGADDDAAYYERVMLARVKKAML